MRSCGREGSGGSGGDGGAVVIVGVYVYDLLLLLALFLLRLTSIHRFLTVYAVSEYSTAEAKSMKTLMVGLRCHQSLTRSSNCINQIGI